MNGKNFVNFHVIISHSPSCLNRDDMNLQKTAVFGGVNRVRISSQSLKRAMRKSPYYADKLGEPSIRTRNLDAVIEELAEELKGRFNKDIVQETARRFVRSSTNTTSEDSDEDSASATAEKKLAVAPWISAEIGEIARIIEEVHNEELTQAEQERAKKRIGKSVGKGKAKHKLSASEATEQVLEEKLKKRLDAEIPRIMKAAGTAVDVALSGRMATSGLMLSIDGSLAVAHALTTHAVEPQDVDWFTAVDDLTIDAGETGAGHLDTQQFSSGVFYRYASLNLRQLQVNLGLIPDMTSPETVDSRRRAMEIAGHVLHMLATIVPSAKQQTFAAHNPADFALVSLADLPISLANAFEHPVAKGRGGGFLAPSIKALKEYRQRLHTAFSLDEQVACFAVADDPESGDQTCLPSLQELEAWLIDNGIAYNGAGGEG